MGSIRCSTLGRRLSALALRLSDLFVLAGSAAVLQLVSSVSETRLKHVLEVHRRKLLRYRRRSKSAMRHSTICGCGDSMYTASNSLFIGRRCSICSMLVMFSFRMSSSRTTLSMILRLPSSSTRTFHSPRAVFRIVSRIRSR